VNISDLYQFWGSDLAPSSNGDLFIATGTIAGEQRVLRRLLTNSQLVDPNGVVQASADYTFHPTYGASLPRQVGMPVNVPLTQATIVSQMGKEQAVSHLPLPIITVTPIQDGINAVVAYNDASSQTPVTLDFDVNK
jgi:hypothetical protein